MSMAQPSKTVLILGARSDIALAVARSFAQDGADLILAARSPSRLYDDAQDLRVRYLVRVTLVEFDVLAIDRHAALLDKIGPLPDVVVCAVGFAGQSSSAAMSFM
jgi:short-subunit dehydrogenase